MASSKFHWGWILFLGSAGGGCGNAAQSPNDYQYPTVPPIWIVEDDPRTTIYERKDLKRDRQVGEMMVIPMYMNYRHGDATDYLAVAHPFVYRQGEEIEKQLASFLQRENLRRLIVWVPGYFPDGMGRTFRWVPTINEREMVVVELQPCIGSEESQINAAMKDMLLGGDIVIGKKILPTPPLPLQIKGLRMTDVPYNAYDVVRSEYSGRYYYGEVPRSTHLPWGFPRGTRIVNRLSEDEKKAVADFAARAAEKEASKAPKREKEG